MKTIRTLLRPAMALVCLAGLLLSITSHAAVYRCKDASGATTYSQTPCKTGQQSQNMSHVQRTRNPAMAQACLAARQFSQKVYRKMQDGTPPEAVIDEHGGVNYINTATLNIINYVGSFRHNTDTPPHKVGSLTLSKCRNGGFGEFTAEDLPLPEAEMMPEMAPPQPSTVFSPPPGVTPPATPTTSRGSPTTIKQLEQYLEQLKAQQAP